VKTDLHWLSSYRQELSGKAVLELGAGNGLDSAQLLGICKKVMVTDLDPNRLKMAAELAPGINHAVLDMRDPFPFADNQFSAVLASLCLHYFPWLQTTQIVSEIKRVLEPGEPLIARVNSTNDIHYGATGHLEIETGLYEVNGRMKRFFMETQVRQLFSEGWRLEALQEKIIDRYEKPKSVWEVLVRSE
jgi:ubiquinone/menaquinone biosynthesis C-methylase UbiE